MQCEYCHKLFATMYVLKNHKLNAKACLIIQGKLEKEERLPKEFICKFCTKPFKSKANLLYHTNICKKKPNDDLLSLVNEIKKEAKEMKKKVEQSSRDIHDKLEDEIYKISSNVKTTQDELEIELRRKNETILQLLEQNKQLEERTKSLEDKTLQPSVVHNNTINNNLTIFTSMSPERVTEIFNKHYTIETLMGGQKALADFVVDKFVCGEGGMVYLCVDRSRKKICYTTNFKDFVEDTNTEMLLSHLIPAYPVIKSKVEWSEYEKKYNPHVDKIHESYDEILAIRNDGTTFRSQLCRRLPSSIEDKERMDSTTEPLYTLNHLRDTEDKAFVERKEEIDRIIAKENKPEVVGNDVPLIPNKICDVGLGRLDGFRLMYKNQGIYKIHKELAEAVASDPAVAQAYEDYIKRGTYKGKVIWE